MASARTPLGRFLPGTHWRQEGPHWDRAWLAEQYEGLGRSAADIAADIGITPNAVLYWLHKHGIPRRDVSEARALKHWGAEGSDNPMWNRRGEMNPNWRGGVTPERQAFYAGNEWAACCSAVWKRDLATCQRCGLVHSETPDMPMHIHHVVSFADRKLRADPDNLVLLCETCHRWIHSKKNKDREFIG